jgi:hypothetical protein
MLQFPVPWGIGIRRLLMVKMLGFEPDALLTCSQDYSDCTSESPSRSRNRYDEISNSSIEAES